MFPIILVFILRESVDRSDNPTSRRNMNSRTVLNLSVKNLEKWRCRGWWRGVSVTRCVRWTKNRVGTWMG